METAKPYRPIDCGFHDRLLHYATLKQEVELVIMENGEKIQFEGVIEDVYTQSGAEFARMSDGRVVRLDQIISVQEEDQLSDGFCRL